MQEVIFSYTSVDGEDGYPGEVEFKVHVQLTNKNELSMMFTGEPKDKTTIINMCNHGYWNLNGHNSGKTVLNHSLKIMALEYTEVDDTLAITGKLIKTRGTKYDLTTRTDALQKEGGVFDLNYCPRKKWVER
eukprot:UN26083